MPEPIEGRVAAILDEYHLIINRGLEHGVKEGMRFVIYAQGTEVKDPETGKPLGQWEFPKGTVEAQHVQDKMTVCMSHTPEVKETTGEPAMRVLSADMISVSMREHLLREGGAERLNVNKAQVQGLPEIAAISVGDRVRSLPAD